MPDGQVTTAEAPTRELSPVRDGHRNNFDGLRLIAALMVMVSHQFVFLHRVDPSPMKDSLGMLAVLMFFVMSGYLVCESWYRDPHLARFLMRRLLRLWPALAVATLAIAIAAASLTTLPLHDYFGHETRQFILDNLRFRPTFVLPGVFTTTPPNPALSAVNGSWWSILLEARCYLYLAGLGLVGLRRRWLSAMVLLLAWAAYATTLPGHSQASAYTNLCYFYEAAFMSGVCARQFAQEIRRHRRVLVVALIAIAGAAAQMHWQRPLEWALIAPLTLWLGLRSTPILRSAARFGDLSYGLYIYAFFVQQVSVHVWPGKVGLLPTLTLSVVATAALAWLSWHGVEAPALQLKRRLRGWFPTGAA